MTKLFHFNIHASLVNGKIKWNLSEEDSLYYPDGTVYDTEADVWSNPSNSLEDIAFDAIATGDLFKRLMFNRGD